MNLSDLIERLKTLDREATPGPWEHGCSDGKPVVFYRATGYESPESITPEMKTAAANLSLVDELRNALPLIIKSLEGTAAAIKQEAVPGNSPEGYYDTCAETERLALEFRAMMEARK